MLSLYFNKKMLRMNRCNATEPEKPLRAARLAFEKKRTESVKKNLSDLLVIATADVKEYTEFLKEIDLLHRKEFEKFIPKKEQKVSEEVEEENIFKAPVENT